jgi:type IV pilus assembly protein PilC
LASFAYKAIDSAGTQRAGTIEADSETIALSRLREQGWTPLTVGKSKRGPLQSDLKIPGISDRIKLKDIAVGSRQLATMIDAGLPLLRALTVMAEQTESKPLAAVWDLVRADVQAGSSFSQALGKHPKAFSPLYVAVVRAGEAGGSLDNVLLRLADTLEKQVNLRNKVRSAMTYPVMVAIMVFLIMNAILIFIVPTFKQLYDDLGGILPVPTRMLLFASDMTRRFFPVFIVLLVVGVFALRRYIQTENGRKQWDKFKLKVPIFGELFRKVAMSRFAQTLAILLRAGVPVLQSLEITKDTVGNKIVGRALDDVETSVREGSSIARPLLKHPVFPPMVTQMLAVGEETGAVDTMLEKVADFYDAEVDATVSALTSLIEPILIVILGAVVGGILISLYLPMFRLVDLIQ